MSDPRADAAAVPTGSGPTPARLRWFAAYHKLTVLVQTDRLAFLDVLARRGALPLGVAMHEAGLGPSHARHHAGLLRKLGMIEVDTGPGGFNLSAPCTITPAGRAVVRALAVLCAGSPTLPAEDTSLAEFPDQ